MRDKDPLSPRDRDPKAGRMARVDSAHKMRLRADRTVKGPRMGRTVKDLRTDRTGRDLKTDRTVKTDRDRRATEADRAATVSAPPRIPLRAAVRI